MKLRVLATFAALGALDVLRASSASAQQVLTPIPLQSVDHSINGFSVFQGDSSIAFDVFVTQPDFTFTEDVWVVQRNVGSRGEQITMNTPGNGAHDPQWNSQLGGPLLAYIQDSSGVGQLVVAAGGAITPSNLAVFAPLSWSTDTMFLVFKGTPPGSEFQGGLYTAPVGGNPLLNILQCPQGACSAPQWSQNDNVIAYNKGSDIALINPNGSADHVIIKNASGPIWSPTSGRYLAYSCGNDICVSSGDGAHPVNITNGALGLVYSNPTWEPDRESLIAMLAKSPSAGFADPGNLYIVSATGGTPIALTSTSDVFNPQFSPDIDEIFYVCQRGTNRDLCVITVPNTSTGPCNVLTCGNGCCTPSGLCLPGTTATACGTGAFTCTACNTGQSCSSSSRQCITTSCTASSCPNGCCDASNMCQSGTTKQTCGTGAHRCAVCVGNQTCDLNQRTCVANLCTSSCSTGCCDAQGQCVAGSTKAACGSNGLPCVTCTGSAQCTTRRLCETPGCDGVSCRSGCCDANGVCQPGNSPSACGSAGLSCVSCNGGACDGNTHTCGPVTTCINLSCKGCCGSDNQCHAGNTGAACGNSGTTCEMCSANQICSYSAGFCQ
jgi:hypothetical protein